MSKQNTTKTASANAKTLAKMQAEINRLRAELDDETETPIKKGKMSYGDFCKGNKTVASDKAVWNCQKQLVWNGSSIRFNVTKAIKGKVNYSELLDPKGLAKKYPYKG